MNYNIIHNPETDIILVTAHGDMTLEKMIELYTEILNTIKKTNSYLLLSDHRDVRVKMSTIELYNLPQAFEDSSTKTGVDVHKIKRAIIPSERKEDFLFYETLFANRGQSLIKIFNNAVEATKWLTEK